MENELEFQDIQLIDTYFLKRSGNVGIFLIEDEEPALIDSGTSRTVDNVLDGLESLGMEPSDIKHFVISHLHLDHAGGAGYLMEEFPDASLYCHPAGKPFLTDPDVASKLVEGAQDALGDMAGPYGDMKVVPESRVETITDGDRLSLGEKSLDVIGAPGHAPHQICLHEPNEQILFTADEVGVCMDGTLLPVSPPPDFDFDGVLKSLERFQSLDLRYLAYPHFGLYDSPYELLEEYRDLIQEWVRMIGKLNDDNDDVTSIVDSLIERGVPHVEIWGESGARKMLRTEVRGVLRCLKEKETAGKEGH